MWQRMKPIFVFNDLMILKSHEFSYFQHHKRPSHNKLAEMGAGLYRLSGLHFGASFKLLNCYIFPS